MLTTKYAVNSAHWLEAGFLVGPAGAAWPPAPSCEGVGEVPLPNGPQVLQLGPDPWVALPQTGPEASL